MNIKLEIPEKFFEGEERCGYYVSSLMKRVWAVRLDLLAELARVCEKHNIKWWIDAGTLLGAVRHKGFIPWDDDADVILMRDEYERLLKVADEFKPPYYLPTNDFLITGLLNTSTTALTSMYKKSFDAGKKLTVDYDACIGIDVFPIDNLPDDDRKNE